MENPLFEIEKACDKMTLTEEEEEIFEFDVEEEEKGGEEETFNEFCLIGEFLTESRIPTEIMSFTLSNLWRPGKGVCIKKIVNNRFSFQFFHELDFKGITDGGPWTFKNHLLAWVKWEKGMDEVNMGIHSTAFWVQVHEVSTGFRSERIFKEVGNYLGDFEKGDPRNFEGGVRKFMRIRAQVLVRKPLKRVKRLRKVGGDWFFVHFKYEKLPTFCFICGIIGHSDLFCSKQCEDNTRKYDIGLRDGSRGAMSVEASRWLRDSYGGAIGGERERWPEEKGEEEDKVGGEGIRRDEMNLGEDETAHVHRRGKDSTNQGGACNCNDRRRKGGCMGNEGKGNDGVRTWK